jgi:endogenous inhibitor of DNA gyrase (YacG/DUF329 family)
MITVHCRACDLVAFGPESDFRPQLGESLTWHCPDCREEAVTLDGQA